MTGKMSSKFRFTQEIEADSYSEAKNTMLGRINKDNNKFTYEEDSLEYYGRGLYIGTMTGQLEIIFKQKTNDLEELKKNFDCYLDFLLDSLEGEFLEQPTFSFL